MPFDYADLLRPGLPAAAQRWTGFPAFNFVGGHNDADNVPVAGLTAAANAVLDREGRTLATYGLESGPQGYRPLREFIAGALKRRAGMDCSADDILVTSGSLQALDLVNAILLASGDTVIAEAATYGGTLSRFNAIGVNAIGAPLDDEGMRIDALAEILTRLDGEGVRAKYIYTIPTVQNPTGSVLPEARRMELLGLSERFGVPIFEDDCYADLLWEGTRPPAIRALGDPSRVIYCGSFSKSVAPALRVGYVVADWPVMSRLLSVKTDAGSGALEQMVLAEYCPTAFDDHVDALNGALRKKADAMVEALEEQFGTEAEFTPPKGGIFLWVTLPERVDTSRLAEVAIAQGVALNPGAEWSTDAAEGRHSMRLCFANPSVEVIREGVAKLADICRAEFGVPKRSANVERG